MDSESLSPRYLTKDDTGQADMAKGLFLKAQAGQIRLVTGPPVLFEVAWTLKVRYKQPPSKISWSFSIPSSQRHGSACPTRTSPGRPSRWPKMTDQDFADAYIHASA
ncbi:MAG: hypothetical protein MZU91_02740 [Desulfosudis oleivorans]|nr:hypothetical protein [Desulfosudis oleivorans]